MATGGNTLESLRSVLNKGEVSFEFLSDITNGFSVERKLGTGSYGTVYTGILKDGVIAVKRHAADALGAVSKEAYGDVIRSIMENKHENVVELLAFCHERREEVVLSKRGRKVNQVVVDSLLCYEYFPMGSLHNNLFVEKTEMDWNMRFEMIKGICEGLKFLHSLPQPIIHLNLKPQNIMLDADMVPKIVDFGYSRIVDPKKSRFKTKTSVGTPGYLAPEYLYDELNEISARFDIYSLGLIIMEITTRTENSPGIEPDSPSGLIAKVEKISTDEVLVMSDYPGLEEDHLSHQISCINIGLRCVDNNQDKRPKIVEIVDQLNALW